MAIIVYNDCFSSYYTTKRKSVTTISERKYKKPTLKIQCGFQVLLQTKSLVETVNTSTGVNQLLLAGIERVALGADFNSDVLLCGTGGKSVATGTTDGSLLVLGMDAFSHVVHLFLLISKGRSCPGNSLIARIS